MRKFLGFLFFAGLLAWADHTGDQSAANAQWNKWVQEYNSGLDAFLNFQRKYGMNEGKGEQTTGYTAYYHSPLDDEKTKHEYVVFEHNTRQSEDHNYYGSGEGLLRDMQYYTENRKDYYSKAWQDKHPRLKAADFQCIPKFVIASHGWSEHHVDGGNGAPTVRWPGHDGSGLYLDTATRYKQGNNEHGRTLDDLAKAIQSGKIVFCQPYCLIEMEGCNTGDAFSEKLSQVSGCQVVYSTGSNSITDTKSGDKDNQWNSQRDAHNSRDGNFYSATPGKYGNGVTYSWRTKIGAQYVSK